MLSFKLKLILICLLAAVSADTLDPCSSEAATKPGGLGLLIKMIVRNYVLASLTIYVYLVIQRN